MESENSFGRYRLCLCTFVDVLGFRELVAASGKDEQAKLKVHTILKHFQQNYHSKGVPGGRSSSEAAMIVKAFSDSFSLNICQQVTAARVRRVINGYTYSNQKSTKSG